jgi:Protein of unknown function (DUF1688)
MISLIEYHYLLSVMAIRERSEQILQLALEDKTRFSLRLEKLNDVAEFTTGIIRSQYPSGKIPLHSRWRHFEINQQNRAGFLQELPPLARVKAQIDLATVSVLLDAGAGPDWFYLDHEGRRWSRSEGLAQASLEMFRSGKFSADAHDLWRVDAEALQQLTAEKLAADLQVSEERPLTGLAGRLCLLQRLGALLAQDQGVFPEGRPGGLYDYLREEFGAAVAATDLVDVLLLHLNSIWPGRMVDGYALGDVWEYPPLGWVPFHKLSLWLALSLIEPLQNAGLEVSGLENLPGLAEYRNGGLFIDGEVIALKDRESMAKTHVPSDALIVEWRALTIALLERLAPLIRVKLNVDARALPLVNILQGGTWQAGRQLAYLRSPAGEPPLRYNSGGTVF